MPLLQDPVLRNPIFLVGATRSGTSFLARTLRCHRDVGMILEPRLTWRYGNDGKSDMLRPGDARDDVRAHIRTTFAQQIQDQGKRRLVEKTPHNAVRLGFVDRVFPDARFVHIMRHGVDAVLSIRNFWRGSATGINPNRIRKGVIRQRWRELSWKRVPYYSKEFVRRAMPKSFSKVVGPALWGTRIPGLEGLVRDLDLLEVCCLQWRMSVESACQYGRRLPKGRYMECRLEDMSPELIRSILAFCELDEDPSVMAYVEENFDASKPSGRKTSCDPAERETILRWIEPTLFWLGYDV